MAFIRLALQILYTALMTGSFLFYLACIFYTIDFFNRKPIDDSDIQVDGVSILIPICGIDDQAWENWSSFCKQIHCDRYEILFGIANPQDPAIPVLQALQASYPDRVKIFIDLPPRGVNYKDSTLSYLLEHCQYEWLIFADSDIRVQPTYIHDIVAPLVADRTDLVTCAFIARHPKHLGSALASLNRCCDFIPSALVARQLDGRIQFAIGMTIALSRPTLERAGGLVFDRIGSDYNLGKRVAQAGFRLELFHQVLESDTGNETLRGLYQRELRWSRTIRFNRGRVYYAMIFCFGGVCGFPLLIAINYPTWAILMLGVTLITRFVQAFLACWVMDAPHLLRWFPWLIIRDGLSFWIWLRGCFGRTVIWRGRQLYIVQDGVIQEQG